MRLPITLAAAVAMLAVSACSGDDDDVTPTPAVTPTASGPIIQPTNVPNGTILPTAVPDLALQNAPEADAIRGALNDYGCYISDEDWDGMCAISAAAIRDAPGLCDSIKESIVTAAANQGVNEGQIDATVDDIVITKIDGAEAAARYTFCIILNGTPNCTFPTVAMTKEADGWKIGFGL